jgi:hypothetical protein
MTKRKHRRPEARILVVEENGEPAIYVEVDGVRIAARGKPDTMWAKRWVPLDPEWRVRDDGPNRIEIQYLGRSTVQ